MDKINKILCDIRKLSPSAFLSGSYRFKRNNPKSDVDIVVIICDVSNIQAKLDENFKPIKKSHYNDGFKFCLNGYEVNIIPLHPVEFICWYKTAQMIDVIVNDVKSMSRQQFHAFHQILLASVKLAISHRIINSKNYLQFIDSENILFEDDDIFA